MLMMPYECHFDFHILDQTVRNAVVIQFFFFCKQATTLIGVWLGEDQRTNTTNTHM